MLIKVVLNQSLLHDVSTERDARLAIRTVQGFTLGIHVLLRTTGSHRWGNYRYFLKKKKSLVVIFKDSTSYVWIFIATKIRYIRPCANWTSTGKMTRCQGEGDWDSNSE
jgi:hypothetical protein